MTELPGAPHAVGDNPAPDTALDNGEISLDTAEAGAGAADGAPPGPAATGLDRRRAVALKLTGGWPLGRIIGVGVLIAGLFSVLAIVIGGAALTGLDSARGRVVDTLDPAAYHASQLEAALLNQETGVRGYALSGTPSFLAPYHAGMIQQGKQVSALRPLLASVPGAPAQLNRILAEVDRWRVLYAEPTITQVDKLGGPAVGSPIYKGKTVFDNLRVSLATLQSDLARQRTQAVASLHHSASVLDAVCIGIAVGLLAVVALFAFGLWRSAILPLSRLAADARQVAGGDFEHRVDNPGGPEEVRAVGRDVDLMRERILAELSAVRSAHASLEARTEDLQRSNSELEQFAYVASHDLQEPLRKVASFCQLLQRRYAGRLDAKADEYIEHAVDGAKRMQALINDLLAFSRVGRTAQQREPVSLGLLLAQAWANLAPEVRRTKATIEQGELPVVLGEATLLTAVFQNLISNALKFRGDQPPRVSVSAQRDGRNWLFAFSDNGIGIEPEYADRIFVIFQRLHDRVTYPGTGIGLAMVKKIIEYHGGQIWLDTEAISGARFFFTLPMLSTDEDADD
jgi:signal transduction histidine kinase